MKKAMERKYRYDAFISYRHCELDKFVAETLHKEMEAFRLPGKVAGKCEGRTKIERVFRDRDELPLANNLEDPIKQALSESEYLIVICSPRLRESMWCQKEIDTFIEMNGKEKIFAVLIEGEPSEAFPEQLLFQEMEVVGADGKVEKVRKPIEPLAADVRGANKKEVKKALKTELLRLLAPIFGLSFDDLKQRHRERRMKRILGISLGVAAVCMAFGAVSTTMALRIQKQNVQIEQQNGEIVKQNEEIVAQSAEIQKKNDALSMNQALNLAQKSEELMVKGDRLGAIEAARESLTEYQGFEMPHTAGGQYALSEALYAYSVGDLYQPVYQMKTRGVINNVQISDDRTKILCSDASEVLYLFDVETGALIKEFFDANVSFVQVGSYCFLDNNRVAYVTTTSGVNVYDLDSDQVTETGISSANYIKYQNADSFLWVTCYTEELRAFDINTFEKKFSIPREGKETFYRIQAIDESNELVAYTTLLNFDTVFHISGFDGENKLTLYLGMEGYIEDVRIYEDGIYVLYNYTGLKEQIYSCQLVCYDKMTFQPKWEFTNSGSTGYLMRISGYESADALMLCTSGEAIILQRSTGNAIQRYIIGTTPIEGFSYTTSELFSVLGRDGNFYSINFKNNTNYLMSSIFVSRFNNLQYATFGKDCVIDVPYSSNVITCYKQITGEGIEVYDGQVPEYSQELLQYVYATDYAEEKHFPDSALVDTIFSSSDQTKAFVHYRNGDLMIYDIANDKIINTVQVSDSVRSYFGQDKEGNHYIGGTGNGYILNADFELIGCVDRLVGLLNSENKVIVKGRGDVLYTIPIRNTEELLALADEIVLR